MATHAWSVATAGACSRAKRTPRAGIAGFDVLPPRRDGRGKTRDEPLDEAALRLVVGEA